ncbi:hypothetical protein [Streptomyces sp. NBC_00268]|uniref:hypothetical protein n=1 Tax=Streptomyces sp. NBC_00268 TaxID=2975695 RepID=UPI00224DD12D|nr:hypothetical protein [Streptomyces sp. NBC_00268]MCX5182619.1 hypothetical protein [Streptomyces sp. NBC_00268]
MNHEVQAQVLAAFGLAEDDPWGQALDALYIAAAADREAHHTRILGELDTIAEDLTQILPPELRAAGLRIAYDTEGLRA